jgi:hypothetical protein
MDSLPLVAAATNVSDARHRIGRVFVSHRLSVPAPEEPLRVEQRGLELGAGLSVGTLSYGGRVSVDVPDGLGDFYLVEVVLRGQMSVRLGEEEFLVKPRHVVVFNPADALHKALSADCELLWVRIDEGLVHARMTELADPLPDAVRLPLPTMDVSRHPMARSWATATRALVRRLGRDPGAVTRTTFAAHRDWLINGVLCALPPFDRAGSSTGERARSRLPRTSDDTVRQALDGGSSGPLVRRHRLDLRLSQPELAALLTVISGNPVTSQRISDWEREAIMIGPTWLPYLAIALEISLDELAGAAIRARFSAGFNSQH